MVNPLLYTFVEVIDSGSFSKAGERLYISSTAVMKQMNSLEDHLNMKLIDRSSSGITLTNAGKVIYDGAKKMIDESIKIVTEAKLEIARYETTFCVGTSFLNPAKPFMDLWNDLSDDFPDYKLHLVPFEDDSQNIVEEIKKLDVKFDFLIGVNDSKTWLSLCNFLPLGRYKKMIAVSRNDPLAKKKIINIEDLYGRTLMMVEKGDSKLNDEIREYLTTNHPQITIEDTPKFYDMSVFNRCAESHKVLLTIECWKDVHPGLATIPVNWDYEIPYGILYSKDSPADVQMFIEKTRQYIRKRNLRDKEENL